MSSVKFIALLALVAVVSCRYGGLRADLRKLQQDLQDGDLSDRIPSGSVSDDDASSGVRDLETFNPPFSTPSRMAATPSTSLLSPMTRTMRPPQPSTASARPRVK
jgi:hypothetical protein